MVTALPDGRDGGLALAFVGTIVHDGNGGMTDLFAADDAVRDWVARRWPDTAESCVAPDVIRRLRRAARAAFAAAVSPHAPSRADAGRLMNYGDAGAVLSAAIAAMNIAMRVDVDPGGVSSHRSTAAVGQTLIVGSLSLAVTDFLCGPQAARLRSCQAPRCVRYFVQDHGRQHWCKPSCGSRARAARFAARHHETDADAS